MNKLSLAAVLLIVIAAGLAQNTGLFILYGIKPDLLLSALIALSFFLSDIFLYGGFIVLAIIFLTLSGNCCFDSTAFALIVFAAPFIGRRFHWQPLFNNLFLIGAGTILFYLLASPTFLITNWTLVMGELIYNLVMGWILFRIFEACLKTNSILKT